MLLPRSKQARNMICAPHRAQNAAASTTAADTRTLRQRYLCYNPQDGRWTMDMGYSLNFYGDIGYAHKHDIDGYLGTPKGAVKMYDHNARKIYNKKGRK